MKFLGLLLSNFRRHKLRTALTILSIAVAFILFSYLAAIRKAFEMGVSVAGADRLVVRHKVSIIQMLPVSYEADIERIPGVADATHATWFGGVYQDDRTIPQIAVKPDEYLAMFPEFLLPPEQKAAFLKTRTGAVAGRGLADRKHWKVGDRIPLQGTIWRSKTSGPLWTFDLVGIYDGKEKETDTSQFLFRYDYLDENRTFGEGMVGWYHIRVKDPKSSAIVARAIDDHFANSPYETKTETEGAFVKGFADQMGNIGAIVTFILSAVFFTILIVAGNTMVQAVRERTAEVGLMKAVGFTNLQVVLMVLGESGLIAAVGGGIGLALGTVMVTYFNPARNVLPNFFLPTRDLVSGVIFVVLLGLITGVVPSVLAVRLNTVDALRRE